MVPRIRLRRHRRPRLWPRLVPWVHGLDALSSFFLVQEISYTRTILNLILTVVVFAVQFMDSLAGPLSSSSPHSPSYPRSNMHHLFCIWARMILDARLFIRSRLLYKAGVMDGCPVTPMRTAPISINPSAIYCVSKTRVQCLILSVSRA